MYPRPGTSPGRPLTAAEEEYVRNLQQQKLEEHVENLRTENHLQTLHVETAERERDEIKADIHAARETQVAEKDRIYKDILSQRKKCELAAGELARLEAAHEKAIGERQKLLTETNLAQDDIKKYRDQIEELLSVNAALRARAEDLENETQEKK
ncbi:hypothetical protein HDU96_008744, partial [Phlyctochytrium bullatum]